MAEIPPVIVQVKAELDEASLTELREKLRRALVTGKPTILPPGPPPGTWELTLEGGPAFASNAAQACRRAARERMPGPSREALERVADAFDHATYGGDPDADPA